MRPADLQTVEPSPDQERALLDWVIQHEQQRWDAADLTCDTDAMFDALEVEDTARKAQRLIEGGTW